MLEYKGPKIWTDAEIIYEMKFWCELEDRDYLFKNNKKYMSEFKEFKEDLIQKLIEIDRWYNEQMQKNKPAIIIDSKGHYVGSCGTASYLDYINAVKEGHVEIHDKKYKDKILNLK